jgi:hypothetical protein
MPQMEKKVIHTVDVRGKLAKRKSHLSLFAFFTLEEDKKEGCTLLKDLCNLGKAFLFDSPVFCGDVSPMSVAYCTV